MLGGKINWTMGGRRLRPFETKRIGSLEHYHRMDSDSAEFQRLAIYLSHEHPFGSRPPCPTRWTAGLVKKAGSLLQSLQVYNGLSKEGIP